MNKKLTKKQGRLLLAIARKSLTDFFSKKNFSFEDFNTEDFLLKQKSGCFVTLTKKARLRGCIGLVESEEPLFKLVSKLVLEAAFSDPRFPELKKQEVKDVCIEISVLSKLNKIKDWQKIRLGKDGVLLQKGFKQGLFLPQVALETGWDLETFLKNLCIGKMKIRADSFKDKDAKLFTFTVQSFSEKSI
jgi:AmmeMemoRadiSam system protein A